MANVYGQLHTSFPRRIQTFKTWDNISQADAEAYATYIEALANRNTSAARDALSRISNADNKLITAADINTITDTIVALENFYNEGIGGAGMREMLAQYAYRGEWNQYSRYVMFNIVKYGNSANNCGVYMCTQQNVVNKAPDAYPDEWVKISPSSTAHGVTTYSGLYDSTQRYDENTLVSYNNVWYICVATASPGENPEDYPDNWVELVDFTRERNAVVSYDEPTDLADGGLWFQIIY